MACTSPATSIPTTSRGSTRPAWARKTRWKRTARAWRCPTRRTHEDRPMIEKKLPPNLHRETLAVRAGIEPSQYGENSEALYLSSSFVQPDAETGARRFANLEPGFTYSRTSNPTVVAFENRLAALEGVESAIGASSGMGAILMMCMGLLKAGDHVVCSRSVFGSTLNLIGTQFGKFGVETTFVSQTDIAEWR